MDSLEAIEALGGDPDFFGGDEGGGDKGGGEETKGGWKGADFDGGGLKNTEKEETVLDWR